MYFRKRLFSSSDSPGFSNAGDNYSINELMSNNWYRPFRMDGDYLIG
ncbi:MAG: hypothetical protein IPQ03_13190 [Bacteroidetes bacterium]|nr:hypothetical protein [Bacteroidota bacterium]